MSILNLVYNFSELACMAAMQVKPDVVEAMADGSSDVRMFIRSTP